MPLGTLDRTPPPFFRQGPSALTKLVFCSALAVFLMVADTRLTLTQPLRLGIATVLHPVERTLLVPVDLSQGGFEYFRGLTQAPGCSRRGRAQAGRAGRRSSRTDMLAAENARLRGCWSCVRG